MHRSRRHEFFEETIEDKFRFLYCRWNLGFAFEGEIVDSLFFPNTVTVQIGKDLLAKRVQALGNAFS